MIIGLVPFGGYGRDGKKIPSANLSVSSQTQTARKIASSLSTPRTVIATPRTEPTRVSPAGSFSDKKVTHVDEKSQDGCPNLFKRVIDFVRSIFGSKKPLDSTKQGPNILPNFKAFPQLEEALKNALRLIEAYKAEKLSDLSFIDVYNTLRALQLTHKKDGKISPEQNMYLTKVLSDLGKEQIVFDKKRPSLIANQEIIERRRELYNGLNAHMVDLESFGSNLKGRKLEDLICAYNKLVLSGDAVSIELKSLPDSSNKKKENGVAVNNLIKNWEESKEKVRSSLTDMCNLHNAFLNRKIESLNVPIGAMNSVIEQLGSQINELKERINDSKEKIARFETVIQNEAQRLESSIRNTTNMLAAAGAGAASYIALAPKQSSQEEDSMLQRALVGERGNLFHLQQGLIQNEADFLVNKNIASSLEKDRALLQEQIIHF